MMPFSASHARPTTVPESGKGSAVARGKAQISAGRLRPAAGGTGPRCLLVLGASLVMQSDGNLVIYSADGPPIWATATNY